MAFSARFALGGLGLAVAYGAFHRWIWVCQFRAMPANRGPFPRPWRMLSAHALTLRRLWRFLTSPFRRLPDFYIAGSMKCGTTALYSYLALHPHIVTPMFKESRFFLGMCGLRLSTWRYRSLFPSYWACPKGCLTFDADATASLTPNLAAAMYKRMTPGAKIILVYREPEKAAWSMCAFRSRIKCTPVCGFTFKQMYDLEMRTVESPHWEEVEQLTRALDTGACSVTLSAGVAPCVLSSMLMRTQRYADILHEFQSRFGKDQVLLVKFSDIATNTEATVRRVFAFLGLDSSIELPALKSVQPEDVVDLVVTSEKKASIPSAEEEALLKSYYGEQRRRLAQMLNCAEEDLW
ncbi:unnamed protein product [Effrenium voratum]|nr:unnamed protein product [Effrenium voratum]